MSTAQSYRMLARPASLGPTLLTRTGANEMENEEAWREVEEEAKHQAPEMVCKSSRPCMRICPPALLGVGEKLAEL